MSARFPTALRDITDDIRARPGRAGLSFLAIAVGMTALTVLLAVLGGLSERSRRIVGELGVNVFAAIYAPAPEIGPGQTKLLLRHAELLAANLPACTLAGTRTYEVSTPGSQLPLKVVATQDGLMSIRQWRLQDGRFLDAMDLHGRERTAVISSALAEAMKWKVGEVIQLRDTPFQVVGIVGLSAGALESESDVAALATGDRVVWVPVTVPPYWLSSKVPPEPELDAIFVRVADGQEMARIVTRVRALLAQPDLGAPTLSFVTPDVLLEKVRRLQRTIQYTVGSIALLCLVLGGTTLMSLMVANVRDRVNEIGLRRALGATRADIALLFVLEAVLVTLAAALTGSLGTHALLAAVQARFPVPLTLGWITVLGPVFIALLLGILFSYGPARAAARISPAEALRNE
jgi:putative ABC transport system permease protein